MIEFSAEGIKNLSAALLAFQAETTGVKRDAKNPHFKSAYATLEAVIDTARPHLQKHGIAFTQAPGALVDGALEITTMLVHPMSGEWMRSTVHVPLTKRDAQGVGSAITYACRYSLMAALGLPPTDDDGESASRHNVTPLRPESPADDFPGGAVLDEAVAVELRRQIDLAKSINALTDLMMTEKVQGRLKGLSQEARDAIRDYGKARLIALGWPSKKAQ
jgi:hypothetical protein